MIFHHSLKATRANHHYEFLSQCVENKIRPKGLTVVKKINIIEGPERKDCLDVLQNTLEEGSDTLMVFVHVCKYYKQLVEQEEEIPAGLNPELTAMNNEVPDHISSQSETQYRDMVTNKQDALNE